MKELWVLHVEDSHAHAELVRIALQLAEVSCHLTRVESGEDAMMFLEKTKNEDRLPDLVLLDINLPVVSGHEVLHWMKSDVKLCTIPVVMLTTSLSPSDVAKCYTAHANSYMVKPDDFDELTLLMRDIGHYWGERNTPIIKVNI